MALRLTAILLLVIYVTMQFGGRDIAGSPFAEEEGRDPSSVVLAVAPLDTPQTPARRQPAPAPVSPAVARSAPADPPQPASAVAAPPAPAPDALAALDMAVIDAAVVGAIDAPLPSRTLAPGVSPSSLSGLDALRRPQRTAAATPPAEGGTVPTGAVLAQVTGSNVNLRSGPSTGTPVAGRAREGDRVEWIDEPSPGWARIRHPGYEEDLYMSSTYLSRMPN